MSPNRETRSSLLSVNIMLNISSLAFRAEQAEQYNPTTEFMDYEMAEFFIKRLKLWIGLTKPKEVGSALTVVDFSIYEKDFIEYDYVLLTHTSPSFSVPTQGEVQRYGCSSFQVVAGNPFLHCVLLPDLYSLFIPIFPYIFTFPSLFLGSVCEV